LANNTWELYTPTTNYPYSRNTIYKDGTNNTKDAAIPGESFVMGSGHQTSSYITPANNELNHYLQVRNKFFPAADIGSVPTDFQYQCMQSVSRDQNGFEVVQIMDKSGKALMTARQGTDLNITNTVTLNALPFSLVMPVAGSGCTVQGIKLYGNGKSFTITSTANAVVNVVGPAKGTVVQFGAGDWGSTIRSDEPFTVVYNDVQAACSPGIAVSQGSQSASSGATPYYYFKILADNTPVSITGGTYSLINLNSETATALIGGNSLNKGYYKVIATGGVVNLSYGNSFTDVSYSFYNQLGQLIATIAPEGVKKLYGTGINNYAVKTAVPFISLYNYNVKGQIISGSTTDGGTSRFVYRKDGSIRFSQSAKQNAAGSFSYTNYDQYGQPVESGEYTGTIIFTNDMSVASTMRAILEDVSSTGGLTGGTQTDVVRTKYNVVDNSHGVPGYVQDAYNMRGSVSMTEKYSKIIGNAPLAADVISRNWYSYDEEGKVLWQIKFINSPGFGYKTIDFTYDNIGHVVKKVFQKNTAAETFVHYFEYDAVNQSLYRIYTNTVDNATTKMLQATYTYYLHGGLKRVELANKLQGIDYTYTLQGALKAINNSNKLADPGGDGSNGVGADAYGMVLDYFPNDYANSRTTGIQSVKGVNTSSIVPTESYSGNIKAMTWYTQKPPSIGLPADPLTYIYKYDPKYQFTESVWGTGINFASSPASFTTTSYNKETVLVPGTSTPAYDANGNILNLQRTNASGTQTDKFAYNYIANTNKLQSVVNTAATTQTYGSYTYDASGQVISETTTDPTNQTKYLKYDVSGKVILVARDAAFTQKVVEFVYDETGMRIMKKSYNAAYQLIQVTYYSGAAVYTQPVTGGVTYGAVTAMEYPIEGASGRLGIYYPQAPVYAYQLTDHLGNVRAVVALSGASPTVRMYTDYYPFGMTIITGGTNDYRYGYQGNYAEKDGETNWNAFELRMYDSRIARWLQYDPKSQYSSPYVAMGNDPTNKTDPDGGCTDCPDSRTWDNSKMWIDPNGSRWKSTSNGWEQQLDAVVVRSMRSPSWGLGNIVNPFSWYNRAFGDRIAEVSNLKEQALASLNSKSGVILSGQFIDALKNDPAMKEREKNLINKAIERNKYGGGNDDGFTDAQVVGFGGQIGGSKDWDKMDLDNPILHKETYEVAANQLTWSVRNATITAIVSVHNNGRFIHIEYFLNDTWDLSPQKGRSNMYDVISITGGAGYHYILGGNHNLVTTASWTSNIFR
jgi:RHS repeat-associated protein